MVTPATSYVAPIITRIESLRAEGKSTWEQQVRARIETLNIIAASTFDGFVHAGAVLYKGCLVAVRLTVNLIPTAYLNPLRQRLQKCDDTRVVLNHARKAAAYVMEILIIPAGLLNPDFVAPLHKKIGLFRPALMIRDTGEDWAKIKRAVMSKETGIASLVMAAALTSAYRISQLKGVQDTVNTSMATLNQSVEKTANSWTLLLTLAAGVGALGFCAGRRDLEQEKMMRGFVEVANTGPNTTRVQAQAQQQVQQQGASKSAALASAGAPPPVAATHATSSQLQPLVHGSGPGEDWQLVES